MNQLTFVFLCCLAVLACPAGEANPGPAPAEEPAVTTPAIDATDFVLDESTGLWSCTLHRPGKGRRKKGKRVDLLLPDGFSADKTYRVLYLLSAIGRLDPSLEEIQRVDAHNTHQLICVRPEVGGWYAEETAAFLMNQVAPLIESRYPVVEGREGRILLGFSKSGWGALSLIFRHPDFFGYAGS